MNISKNKETILWDELDKNFDDALFSCTNVATLDELIKAIKPYPRIYYSYEIKQSIITLIVTIILGSFYDFSIIEILGLALFFISIIFALHGATFPYIAKNLYPSFYRNEISKVFLYDNFVIFKHKSKILKFEYTTLDKIVETSDTIYLLFSDDTEIRIIPKSTCNEDCINFLRSIKKEIYKYKDKL